MNASGGDNGSKGAKKHMLIAFDVEEARLLKTASAAVKMTETSFVQVAVHQLLETILVVVRASTRADARAFVEKEAKREFRMLTKKEGPWRELHVRTKYEAFIRKLTEATMKSPIWKAAYKEPTGAAGVKPWGANSKSIQPSNFEFRDFTSDPDFARAVLNLGPAINKESNWPGAREKIMANINRRMAMYWVDEVFQYAADLGLAAKTQCDRSKMHLSGKIGEMKYTFGSTMQPSSTKTALGPKHLDALKVLLSFVDPKRLSADYTIRVEDFERQFPEPEGTRQLGKIMGSWIHFRMPGGFTKTSNFASLGFHGLVGLRRMSFKFSEPAIPIIRSFF